MVRFAFSSMIVLPIPNVSYARPFFVVTLKLAFLATVNFKLVGP